ELPSDQFVASLRELGNQMIGRGGALNQPLWRHVKFQFELVENGQIRNIRKSADWKDCSSNGLAHLVLITCFIGFIETIRRHHDVNFVVVLDELAAIDKQNVRYLIRTLTQKNLTLLAACPDISTDLANEFAYQQRI